MTLIACGHRLVIDAGSIVLARMESVAGRTGDIAIGPNTVRVIAGENDEGGR